MTSLCDIIQWDSVARMLDIRLKETVLPCRYGGQVMMDDRIFVSKK